LKKKKNFLFKIGFWAESTVWPSQPHRGGAACAAQQIHEHAPRSRSKPDPIAPDLTR
jgi:hypothetical protein